MYSATRPNEGDPLRDKSCYRLIATIVPIAGTQGHKSVTVLLVSGTDFLPVDFPSELADAALLTNNEVAWQPTIAAQVVEWLGLHQYAVLGTELWVIRDGAIHSLPIGQTGMPEVHGNTVDRRANEPWAAFVSRAASATVVYLRSFHSREIVEPGEIRFNVTWVSEEEFEKLGCTL